MNPLQIDYFLSVAATGSLTKSAKLFYVSPPAVSRQILALEEELGFPLFVRTGRGVKLLPAGERIRDVLVINQQRFADVQREIQEAQRGATPPLRFGFPSTWKCFELLAKIQTHLSQRSDGCQLAIRCAPPNTLLQMLTNHELDLIMTPVDTTGAMIDFPLEQQYLCSIHRIFLYGSKSPLAKMDLSNLSVFSSFPLLTYYEHNDTLQKQVFEHICINHGFRPIVHPYGTVESAICATGAGLGFCIVDEWCDAIQHPSFSHTVLPERVHICLFWNTGNSNSIVQSVSNLLLTQYGD